YRPGLSDLAYRTRPSIHPARIRPIPFLHSPVSTLYHRRTHSGVATWFQSAPSPSPPSGALVNSRLGLRPRPLRASVRWAARDSARWFITD
ncbi:unnamed protein product, partial [Staurois parvus]